jgi:hypothetical protein
MFKHKNVWISLAVATLLAACGGGGDGTPAASTASTGTTTAAAPPATQTPATQTPATQTPATQTPATQTPTTPVQPADFNALMAGHMELARSQVIVNGTNIAYSDFNGGPDGAYSLGDPGSSNAPVKTFGLRIRPVGMENQMKNVRLAFELVNKVDQSQILQILIDQVTIKGDANNDLTVEIAATAKMYIFVKNAQGAGNLVVSNLDKTLVSIAPVPGDTTSALSFNVENAINAAIAEAATERDTTKQAALNGVKDYTARFKLDFTLSNVALTADLGGAALPPVNFGVTGANQLDVLGDGKAPDGTAAQSASVTGTRCQVCDGSGKQVF